MQSSLSESLSLQKRQLGEESSSPATIFESECLAIIMRHEMEGRSFVKNLHPELHLMQMLHMLPLAVCFSAARYSFLQFPPALSGRVLYSQLLLHSLYLTSIFIPFITSASSTDSSSSHGYLFSFSYSEHGGEREKMHFTL